MFRTSGSVRRVLTDDMGGRTPVQIPAGAGSFGRGILHPELTALARAGWIR